MKNYLPNFWKKAEAISHKDSFEHLPFNAAQKIITPFFSKEEHNKLFGQFEHQEDFVINSHIKYFIYHQTYGAPIMCRSGHAKEVV